MLRDKAESRDIYALAKLCDALNKCPCAIDLIGQLHHPFILLEPLEQFCNEWKPSDSEMDVDNRSSSESDHDDDMDGVRVLYSKFGKVWTLVVLIVRKFNVSISYDDTRINVDMDVMDSFIVTYQASSGMKKDSFIVSSHKVL